MTRKFSFIFWIVLFLNGMTLIAYDVILFGDVHFDAKEVHSSSAGRPDYQERWKEDIPSMLDRASGKVRKDTAFVIQLGDIVQGDCGSQELHEKALNMALSQFNDRFPGVRFFTVPGNHDIRGEGAKEAYGAVMNPFLSKMLGKPLPPDKPVQYAVMYKNDLYIFMDCNHPDLEFLQKTLEKHPKRRHLFVLTHFPVLFLSSDRRTIFFYQKYLQDSMFDLLAKNHAIVFCAHAHTCRLVRFKNDVGTITQLSLFSIFFSSKLSGITSLDPKQEIPNLDTPEVQIDLSEYLQNYAEFNEIQPSAGFAVLNVADNGVFVELYNAIDAKPSCTLKLK